MNLLVSLSRFFICRSLWKAVVNKRNNCKELCNFVRVNVREYIQSKVKWKWFSAKFFNFWWLILGSGRWWSRSFPSLGRSEEPRDTRLTFTWEGNRQSKKISEKRIKNWERKFRVQVNKMKHKIIDGLVKEQWFPGIPSFWGDFNIPIRTWINLTKLLNPSPMGGSTPWFLLSSTRKPVLLKPLIVIGFTEWTFLELERPF